MLEIAAMYMGRRINGTVKPMIVIAEDRLARLKHGLKLGNPPPLNNAEAPAPATALPMMSITLFLAAAHITEPSSKRISEERYMYLTLKYVYIRPNEGCSAVVVKRYAMGCKY